MQAAATAVIASVKGKTTDPRTLLQAASDLANHLNVLTYDISVQVPERPCLPRTRWEMLILIRLSRRLTRSATKPRDRRPPRSIWTLSYRTWTSTFILIKTAIIPSSLRQDVHLTAAFLLREQDLGRGEQRQVGSEGRSSSAQHR